MATHSKPQQIVSPWASSLKTVVASVVIAGGMALAGMTSTQASEPSTSIDLVYVWTAKPGMSEQLVATYDAVGEVLKASEPGLLTYDLSVSETGEQIVIHEVFENGEALAFHLSGTAAKYFPQISRIATPGPFIFRGNVPDELRKAAYQMNMGAIFLTERDRFKREK